MSLLLFSANLRRMGKPLGGHWHRYAGLPAVMHAFERVLAAFACILCAALASMAVAEFVERRYGSDEAFVARWLTFFVTLFALGFAAIRILL